LISCTNHLPLVSEISAFAWNLLEKVNVFAVYCVIAQSAIGLYEFHVSSLALAKVEKTLFHRPRHHPALFLATKVGMKITPTVIELPGYE
jgi:hypothetical protein